MPGTLLLPGEKDLGPPRLPPNVPWAWVFPHDPLHGPRDPHEETTLYDGGDRPPEAGFGLTGKLVGVNFHAAVRCRLNFVRDVRAEVPNFAASLVKQQSPDRRRSHVQGNDAHLGLRGPREARVFVRSHLILSRCAGPNGSNVRSRTAV